MSSPCLTKGLLIAALLLISPAIARASACGDAARNYNRTVRAVDGWYLDTFEKVTGLPASSRITVDLCPTILPLLRERLRRHRAILQAYNALQGACGNVRVTSGEFEGIKIEPPPVVLRHTIAQLQMCERPLATRHARLNVGIDVGPRSCTNQLGRCISYRRTHGPAGSEGVCSRVYRACLRSGVWDATAAFPYGGARATGMIRR